MVVQVEVVVSAPGVDEGEDQLEVIQHGDQLRHLAAAAAQAQAALHAVAPDVGKLALARPAQVEAVALASLVREEDCHLLAHIRPLVPAQ